MQATFPQGSLFTLDLGSMEATLEECCQTGELKSTDRYSKAPPAAGAFVRKRATNGWHFWRLDPNGRRPLKEVRTDYLRVVSPEEAEGDDADSADAD